MKIKALSIFIFLFITKAYSQELLSVRYYDRYWLACDSIISEYKREFYLNKDSTYLIKDYYSDGKIQMIANYKTYTPMVEDGNFEFYYKNGQLNLKGNYCNGKLCGTWIKYNESGNEVDSLDYDFNIIYSDNKINKEVKIYYNNQLYCSIDSIDSMPKFKNLDDQAFQKYIANNLVYPLHAFKYHKDGEVIIKFVVDQNGNVNNIEIVKSAYKDLDKESVRVIASSPKWEPGYSNNLPINVEYTIPIKFGSN